MDGRIYRSNKCNLKGPKKEKKKSEIKNTKTTIDLTQIMKLYFYPKIIVI